MKSQPDITEMLEELEERMHRGRVACEAESSLRRENDELRGILRKFARAGYEQTWRYSTWKKDEVCVARSRGKETVSIFVFDELIDETMHVLGVVREEDEGKTQVALSELEE